MKSLIISGMSSNSGKTISSLCLEAGLLKLGKKISCFKFGPDFIDPSYHRLFAECYNLDPAMSSEDFVKYLFLKKSSEYNIIEGAMGLFDGEAVGISTFKLSKILGIKNLLCVDVSGMGESIRGIAKGFKEFSAGVIAVKVASGHHLEIIRDSLKKENVKLIGYIPKSEQLEIPSRHLGLYISDEVKAKIKKELFEEIFFKCFDVREIMKLFDSSEAKIRLESSHSFDYLDGNKNIKKKTKVGILSGKLFPFVYPENILLLLELGFEVFKIELEVLKIEVGGTFPRFDILLIPGGYPEVFADELKESSALLKNILKIPKLVIAECGGLEILSRSIIYGDKKIDGLGIFPFDIKIEERPQAIGWRKLEIKNDKNLSFKGHEFHYGRITNVKPKGLFLKYDMNGKLIGTDGFRKGKFISFWTHLYFGSNPRGIAELFSTSLEYLNLQV